MSLRASWLAGALALAFIPAPVSANGVIVHAARKLRLSYAEPVPPKDLYVNMGARHGVKVGDRLPVIRNLSVRDSLNDGTIHLISVPMGYLTVITVGETASIGREEVNASPATLPSLQYASFQVGDEVLPKTSLPSGSALP